MQRYWEIKKEIPAGYQMHMYEKWSFLVCRTEPVKTRRQEMKKMNGLPYHNLMKISAVLPTAVLC